MNAINHRRRLAERREAAKTGNLASFRARSPDDIAVLKAAPTVQVLQPAPANDTPDKLHVAVTDPVPGMTPQQLREKAAEVVLMLVEMSDDDYKTTLDTLETQDPVFYAVVVDELNNFESAHAADVDVITADTTGEVDAENLADTVSGSVAVTDADGQQQDTGYDEQEQE